MSFLAILFMLTGENGLVCYFCPDSGIWASGKTVEALPAALAVAAVGAGLAPEKTTASRVDSLLIETGCLVESSRVS